MKAQDRICLLNNYFHWCCNASRTVAPQRFQFVLVWLAPVSVQGEIGYLPGSFKRVKVYSTLLFTPPAGLWRQELSSINC